MGDWLDEAINVGRRDEFDPWLWDNTELAFNRRYMDQLSQERAMTELENGVKMEKGDLDEFISQIRTPGTSRRSQPRPYHGTASIHRRVATGHV